jgi:hypothetical protein
VKRALLITAALAAVGAGYLYWASDARRIARLLDDVVAAVSQEEGESGIGALAEIASLNTYLAPGVTITIGSPAPASISGAQEVVSTVGRLRAVFPVLRLALANPQISIGAGGSATVHATARLTMRSRDGDESVDARDAQISLEKQDGRWVIAGVDVGAAREPAR